LALNSPLPYSTIQLRGRFISFGTRNGKRTAEFSLVIPPGAIMADEVTGHVNFDVVGVARAEGGKEAGRLGQHIDRVFTPENIAEIKRIGINYTNRLDLGAGEYGVWFVVRDNLSGRTGSTVVSVRVPEK